METGLDDLRLHFRYPGSGLKIGTSPWVGPGAGAAPTDHLAGFTVAGQDRHWFFAEAKIVLDNVVDSSPAVPAPVAARYAWAAVPENNLYNRENYPASPFRTDDWPLTAASAPASLPAP